MKIEVDITKYKITVILQIIATIIFVISLGLAFILEMEKTRLFIYLGVVLLVIFFNRYLHETCHYIVGLRQGFRCEVKFGVKMSECRVYGVQTFKQVALLALAPLYLYVPASVLVLLFSPSNTVKLLVIGVLGLCLGGMIGDFIYVYEALRNRGGKFTDNGHVLIIEK